MVFEHEREMDYLALPATALHNVLTWCSLHVLALCACTRRDIASSITDKRLWMRHCLAFGLAVPDTEPQPRLLLKHFMLRSWTIKVKKVLSERGIFSRGGGAWRSLGDIKASQTPQFLQRIVPMLQSCCRFNRELAAIVADKVVRIAIEEPKHAECVAKLVVRVSRCRSSLQ